ASLEGAQLSGARLVSAQCDTANMGGAVASRAQLMGADLTEAYLGGANLQEANFSHAQLVRANLEQAEFTAACLAGADMNGAYKEGAVFVRAVLDTVTFPEPAPVASAGGEHDHNKRYFGKGDTLGNASLEFGEGCVVEIESRFEKCSINLKDGA